MFAKLSELLATGDLIDFTLTRTTLEKIFINFAKFQVQTDINGQVTGYSQPQVDMATLQPTRYAAQNANVNASQPNQGYASSTPLLSSSQQ